MVIVLPISSNFRNNFVWPFDVLHLLQFTDYWFPVGFEKNKVFLFLIILLRFVKAKFDFFTTSQKMCHVSMAGFFQFYVNFMTVIGKQWKKINLLWKEYSQEQVQVTNDVMFVIVFKLLFGVRNRICIILVYDHGLRLYVRKQNEKE